MSPAAIKAVIVALRRKVKPGTVKLCVALLSSLYSDLIEDGHANTNPCKGLSKQTRALMRSTHDPKNTPYLHEATDVDAVTAALYCEARPVGIAYAIGALAGLRTGEVRALDWSHVDLEANMLHVQVQVGDDGASQTLKDRESRFVPVQPNLLPILRAWRAIDGGQGLVCKPLRRGSRKHLDDHTMSRLLRKVVANLGLVMSCSCCHVPAAWYEYSRHTYACQWVIGGKDIESLSRTLGHSSIAVTERHYVHLRPGYYSVGARNALTTEMVQTANMLANQAPGEGGETEVKAA